MDKFNIFSHIIQNEKDLVNVLRALLVYEPFRSSFFKLLTKGESFSIQWEDIISEYPIEQGRPDLAILNKDIIIFIEIKLTEWCKLTPNQPNGYISELQNISNNRKQLLAFLLPPNYFYKKTLEQRLKEASDSNNCPQIALFSWVNIIELLKNNELIYLNSNLKNFYE